MTAAEMTEAQTSTDRIEKHVTLRAPRARVWRALTDSAEFGAWFGMKVEGQFKPGASVRGKINNPKYAHMPLELVVQRIEPETYFSYRWHPYPMDAKYDYSKDPMTLVEFRLSDAEGGTALEIVESGFDKLPASRRAEAFRANDGGWNGQVKNIEKYVAAN
jgi:uncharacterized protein YndB with AHSA1/START domain